jgi:hypothetical protein
MAITNSAPHEFDIARYILNTAYTASSAFQPNRSDAVVARVFLVLETTDGQIANIEINNNAAYIRQNRAFLHFVQTGTPSSIASNAWDGTCAALNANGNPQHPTDPRVGLPERHHPHRGCHGRDHRLHHVWPACRGQGR